MSDNQLSGAQQSEVGDSTENQVNISKQSSAVDDFKRDMLRYKDEVSTLRDQLKQYEIAEQEQKGNLQAVIQKLKDENKQLKNVHAQDRVSFAEGKLEESIKSIALQKGCKDADTFYKLIDKVDLDTVQLDDRFNASKDDISTIVENYSKKYEHLGFFGKKVNIVDKAPNAKPVEKEAKTKTLDDMSTEELLELAGKTGLKRIQY